MLRTSSRRPYPTRLNAKKLETPVNQKVYESIIVLKPDPRDLIIDSMARRMILLGEIE